MKHTRTILIPFMIVLMLCFLEGHAQSTKKASVLVQSTLVDTDNKPIPNALIELGDGLVSTRSDKEGNFNIEASANNIMIISANGFEDISIDLSKGKPSDKITLNKALLFTGASDEIVLPANVKTTQRELTGAVSKIKGSELESQPDAVFNNALQGRLSGLVTRMTTNGLGNNVPEIFVRGLGREGSNGALTLVDGVERPLEFLNAEEIESVEVLKDASTKILYGPRAANGVVLITTKRGRTNTQVIKGSVQYGVNNSTRIAQYLNSADYATLYNEALANDGISPIYTPEDIQGYRNSTGENDQLYPNINHNDYFLNENAAFRKANFEYSGGTEDSRYGVYLGYVGTDGIEKVGKTATQDRFNVRGQLDFKITDNLTGYMDGNGIIESRNWGKVNQDALFGKINSERPNEFPFVISDPNFSGETPSLGDEIIPPLGGTIENTNSLYGDMIYGGYREYQFFYGQTNFALDWDMKGLLKGLSATSKINFDNYQYHAADQISNPVRYATRIVEDENGLDSLAYIKLNNRVIERNRTEAGHTINRTLGWTSNIKYKTVIAKDNKLAFDLSYFYFLNQERDRRQHIKTSNTYLKANYSYKDKLYLEMTTAIMGSNKFSSKKELHISNAISGAWILSEENFLENSKAVNFLKLKTSYGVLGYDRATSFYLFDTRYDRNGSVRFGERNTGGNVQRTGFENFGNPYLNWEESEEFNVGLEGLLFNNSLMFEVNYFSQNRNRIIVDSPSSIYTSINGGLNAPQNLGEVFNSGVDASINWYENFGDFNLNIGANALFSKNKVQATNQPQFPDENLNRVGLPSDVIFGYVSNGLFKTQQEVDAAPFQTLSPYGVGNISYKDLNNDGIVNEQDRTVIGNDFPRTSLGVTINAKYKGFALSVLGTSELGVDMIKNNAYFRNSGQGKYSTLALDRFHPVNNPNGTQPILTTQNTVNDNVTSSFWLESASFFRMKNVELSYTISNDLWTVKSLRFYARGTNLFVVSNLKDLDPEVPNSGVNNYPLFRTITGGVTLGF